MLLNRYFGSSVQEFPVLSVSRMLRYAVEQDLRDELRPIWIGRMIVDKLTGQQPISFEELFQSLITVQDTEKPADDTLAELDSIVKRYREVQDGVDIPAVR